tara:strand:- start:423 stop:650 length:228 start_codon:yes stop_codon:yes gene_type:complete
MTLVENDYDEEDMAFENGLEEAVKKYAKSLDTDGLREYVIHDLYDHYSEDANYDEAWNFIDWITYKERKKEKARS